MIVSSARLRDDIKNKLIQAFPQTEFHFFNNMSEAKEKLKYAEVLITYGEDLNDELVGKAEALKWIMVISAGLDKMPFDALKERNIVITNARGIHQTPMAEYTISMVLNTARKVKVLMENQSQHVWDRKVPMAEISGKTIGVLGTGAVGGEVARLAKAFRMTTIGFNRSGNRVPHFDEIVDQEGIGRLYEESDFIVNVLPSTPLTEGLINKQAFSRMKSTAVLINIGRGTTINEKELIAALQDQQIGHAVLDVFEKEPLSADSPLWDMENVTVTPHLSGISPQYQDRAIEIFIENFSFYRKKEVSSMKNIIPFDRGY
jgi:phosphoglycerate dehydrogenase-like enzyme